MVLTTVSKLLGLSTPPALVRGWAQFVCSVPLEAPIVSITQALAEVLQAHGERIVGRLFTPPHDPQAIKSGYQTLDHFLGRAEASGAEFHPLIEGMATVVRDHLLELQRQLEQDLPPPESPTLDMVERYDEVLRRFLPTGHRRIILEVGQTHGPLAVKTAILAIERHLPNADLPTLDRLLAFLKDFGLKPGTTFGFNILRERQAEPAGPERALAILHQKFLQRLLQLKHLATFEEHSPFRYLYECTVYRKFESKGTMKFDPKTHHLKPLESDPIYAARVMVAVLEKTLQEVEREIAGMG